MTSVNAKTICPLIYMIQKGLKYFITLSGIITVSLMYGCTHPQKVTTDSVSSGKYSIHPEFKKYFDACGVEGSIAIFDNSNNQWIVSDTTTVMQESLPASTFKIINLLIALETKTIANEMEIIKWPGSTDTVKYGYRPEIYHDMTVKEAFEASAGWVFTALAQKIGKENYKKYLALCNYGNLNLEQPGADFWNFGNFGISPLNQVAFLKQLYKVDLPFSKRNMDIVKKVMIAEQNEQATIRAKTGWTRENNINTGWWVGYLENKNGIYFFATRLIQDRKFNRNNFGACRKEITKKIFDVLKIAN
jgi:beta-lactamase class D